MNNFSKILKSIGILAVVVAVGALIGYWASSSSSSGTPTPNVPANSATEPGKEARNVSAPSANPKKQETAVTHPASNPNQERRLAPGPGATSTTPGTTSVATNLVPDWEEKVDTILTSDDPDPEKAKKMLAMFPLLTGDAQEEVAHHLSNLIADEDYAPFGSYLTNTALPEDILDILLEDVLNRPNTIKLPMLLEVARDPQNPKSAEAKDVLELFLEEDYGADWAKWETKTKEWLKENPD